MRKFEKVGVLGKFLPLNLIAMWITGVLKIYSICVSQDKSNEI
jgi:hypothetical protein